MTISIHELATTDFSDIATGNQLEPVTPGAILLHDFMEPVNLSANALATALHVPANRITIRLRLPGQTGISTVGTDLVQLGIS